jgi:hypothetical protein
MAVKKASCPLFSINENLNIQGFVHFSAFW